MTDFSFIENPNLPCRKVAHAVVSPQYPQVTAALQSIGIKTLSVCECKDVLYPLRNHSDMLFSYLGSGSFAVENSQIALRDSIKALGGIFVDDSVNLSSSYPNDIPLNFCVIGNNVIGLADKMHPKMIFGRKLINVRQGYAKCSCVPVDENSLITDDSAIYSICSTLGMDVLLVGKGSVRLEGFDFGFIGGCCGKISKDTVAFCGDIKLHTDYKQIDAFLRERNVYPLSLFGGSLLDIGSIIPITEYN